MVIENFVACCNIIKIELVQCVIYMCRTACFYAVWTRWNL